MNHRGKFLPVRHTNLCVVLLLAGWCSAALAGQQQQQQTPPTADAGEKARAIKLYEQADFIGHDGKVRDIRVISGLGYGLTESAIAAVRRIKFIPATKDGRPVSQFMKFEYNFNYG